MKKKYRDLIFFMFIYLLIIIVFIMMNSCSPTRMLNNIIKNHPELLSTKSDTIISVKQDVVITKQISTEFKDVFKTDTLYVKETPKVITRVKVIRDSIFVSTTVKPDTIIIQDTTKVITNTNSYTVNKYPFWDRFYIGFLSFLLLIILIYAIKKR